MRTMALYRRYANVAPSSRLADSSLSSSRVSSSVGTPNRVGRQVQEVALSETMSANRIVSTNSDFEAITINDHAPAFTLAPSPATSETGISSSWTTSRTRSESSPVVFALGASSTSSTLYNGVTSSQRLTDITAVPLSPAHASTGSNVPPSLSSTASGSVPTQTSTASPVELDSARTTGIIIGSVLGGLAVLVTVGLAIIYTVWLRRRRRRADQADREKGPTQKQSDEPEDAARNTTAEQERSTESPISLPLQGATSPRTLRSEPIIVDTISPISPITPHLSRWTSEKADIPSPAGHPAIDSIPPHLRHHPLFASRRYDHEDQDDDDEVSPCSSSSPSPGPQGHTHPAPALEPDLAAADAAFAGFLFFDSNSPSSRSSTRRPSTRDSSAPRTALSMPPPHRPPPRRRHTRAGGQGRDGAARPRRGSGSSVSGGGGGVAGGSVVASSARPPSLPPPLPARNAARSKSLHNTERPAVWI